MRLLVTGVTGQVGSAISARFSSAATVIAADRRLLDLSRPSEIANRLDELNPELIINPAAYTAVDRAESEPDIATVINAAAPEAIARWALRRGVPLVHFSTDYVFDGEGSRPWREDDATAPLNTYGRSKLAGEQSIRNINPPHLIIRTSWIYSAGGNSFLKTIRRLAQTEPRLRIVCDQIGAPTSASFLADALFQLVRAHRSSLPETFERIGRIVHLSANGETSWHGFAVEIVSALRRKGAQLAVEQVAPISTKDYPTPATRPLNSRLDLTRAKAAFGLDPPPWSELLARELDRVTVI